MLNVINIFYLYFLLKYTRVYERHRKNYYYEWSDWEKVNGDGKIRLRIITLILISIYFILIFFSPLLQLITLILLIIFNFLYLIKFDPHLFRYTDDEFERKFSLEEKYLNKICKYLNKFYKFLIKKISF